MHPEATAPAGPAGASVRPLKADRAPLSRFWTYAAAFGALWGALEVTVGSFLHALHVPFAGVVLAAVGAGLLVAERQVLNRRGLCIATGLVAALCKSLSPAGIIWAPMIGIAAEAALVEAALLLAPGRAPSAAVAGGLAVVWAIGQGLINQYITYGANIIALYISLVQKTTAWAGLAPRSGWHALAAVAGIFFLAGAASGLWGLRIGRICRARVAGLLHV
jgi:hypothetical protein